MKRNTTWLIAVMLVPFTAHATEPPAVQWVREYPDTAAGCSGQQTTNKGYIIAGGICTSQEEGSLLLKVDSLGQIQWKKVFSGTMPFHFCQQTRDGGYVATTEKDGMVDVVKTDSLGNLQWEKVFDDSGGPQTGWSIRQTRDGGYIIGATNECYVWVIRTDSLGNKVWDRTITDNNSEYFDEGGTVPVEEAGDGGYVVGAADTQALLELVKYDSLGNIQWKRVIDNVGAGYPHSLQRTRDGGYVVTGLGPGAGGRNLYLLKTDSLGRFSWYKSIDGNNGMDFGVCVRQTSDGGYIAVGEADPEPGSQKTKSLIVRTDSLGTVRWKTIFGEPDEVYLPGACQQTEDGGYVIVGDQTKTGGIYLLKFAPEERRLK